MQRHPSVEEAEHLDMQRREANLESRCAGVVATPRQPAAEGAAARRQTLVPDRQNCPSRANAECPGSWEETDRLLSSADKSPGGGQGAVGSRAITMLSTSVRACEKGMQRRSYAELVMPGRGKPSIKISGLFDVGQRTV